VDLAGTESLAVLALKAVQAVQHPVPGGEGTTVPHARVVTMTDHGSVVTTIVPLVRRGRDATMIVQRVRVVMMTAHGSAAMTTVQRVRVETTTARRGRAAAMMTVRGSAAMMIAPRVRVETMVDRVVRVGKIRVPVFVVTMTVPHARVETILVRVDLELQRSSARMKSATRVAVAA